MEVYASRFSFLWLRSVNVHLNCLHSCFTYFLWPDSSTSLYNLWKGDTGNLCNVSGSFVEHSYSQSLLPGGYMSFWKKVLKIKISNFECRWKHPPGDTGNKNSGIYELLMYYQSLYYPLTTSRYFFAYTFILPRSKKRRNLLMSGSKKSCFWSG